MPVPLPVAQMTTAEYGKYSLVIPEFVKKLVIDSGDVEKHAILF